IEEKPEVLIGDKPYDSDQLDKSLKRKYIKMVAPIALEERSLRTAPNFGAIKVDGKRNGSSLGSETSSEQWCVARATGGTTYGFVQLACMMILIRQEF